MGDGMHRRTVYIVDDDAGVRDAVSLVLSLEGHATASFNSAEAFLQAWQPPWQGCLLLDLKMQGMSGLELQRRLQQAASPLRVVFMTAHGDVAAAREAFLADAVDFLEKPFDPQQLLAAVGRGLRPRPAVQPGPLAPPALTGELSPRELQVTALLVQGLPHRQIANALGISPRTVEVHKARILQKTGAANVVELVHRHAAGTPADPTQT